MPPRKLPLWKTLVFSLIPALLLLVAIEGASRVIWSRLEADAAAKDPNKSINYEKMFDPVLGYRLIPNFDGKVMPYTHTIGRYHYSFPVLVHTNSRGFMQRDEVSQEKAPNSLRIMAVGKSTTEGHNVDRDYPSVLRELFHGDQAYPGGVEVINAGIAGYISDQWALYAERELAALKPDVVIFYAGWNDFQGYNPYLPPPNQSWFKSAYGYLPGPARWLKSVTLLSALLAKLEEESSQKKAEVARESDDEKVDADALIHETDIPKLESGLEELQARQLRYEAKLQALEAEPQKRQDKIDRRKAMLEKLAGAIQQVTAKIGAGKPSEPSEKDRIRANYKYFLLNLDRAVAAFRQQNPDVRIVVSTLVGRWPYESESYFRDGVNAVGWMKTGPDTSQTAAQHLARFNDLIRDNAKAKGWTLIDSAAAFQNVNREEFQWDFAHFTDEGYRKLAETIYHGMLDQGVAR